MGKINLAALFAINTFYQVKGGGLWEIMRNFGEKYRTFYAMDLIIGEYLRNIDEKYRVPVPANIRKLFQQKELIIRKDFRGHCLMLSTVEEYEQLPKDIKDIIQAHPVTIDNKGRIFIPPQFREMIKITQCILFRGAGNCVELWPNE